MRRFFRVLAVVFILLSLRGAVSQTSSCPAADPVNRPSGVVAPSAWNLRKLVNQMQYPQAGLILVTSHRGNWEFCPENTLESLQSAWDLGAEGAEMDVRTSGPGQDGGSNYPNGEIFLSHDFDLRGEAPLVGGGQSTHYIYSLSPSEIRSRQMSDRHGSLLNDSNGNPVRMHSFTDLLDSYYARAVAVGYQPGNHASPITTSGGAHWDLMNKGLLLTIDVKSYLIQKGTSWVGATQFETFMECVREMSAWQDAHQTDLRDAIAFKVGFNEFYFGNPVRTNDGAKSAAQLKAALSDIVNFKPQQQLPRLIFILFPEDAVTCDVMNGNKCECSPNRSGSIVNCSPKAPSDFVELNDIDDNYTDSTSGTLVKGLLVNDWQYRNPGDSLEAYFSSTRWISRGAAMFLASNNFAEGVRNSGGDCSNTFVWINAGTVNTSYCTSDPLQRWASSALDYLVPASGLAPPGVSHRATSITTDQYENAINYLDAIGLNNTAIIQ